MREFIITYGPTLYFSLIVIGFFILIFYNLIYNKKRLKAELQKKQDYYDNQKIKPVENCLFVLEEPTNISFGKVIQVADKGMIVQYLDDDKIKQYVEFTSYIYNRFKFYVTPDAKNILINQIIEHNKNKQEKLKQQILDIESDTEMLKTLLS